MFTFNKLIDEKGSFINYRALTEASVLVRARNGNAVQAGAHTPLSELNENSAANVVFILSFWKQDSISNYSSKPAFDF